MNIWLPLFWSTWSWAQGQELATCAGLAPGHWLLLWFSLGAKVPEKARHCVSLNCWKYWKKVAQAKGFSTLIPQTASDDLAPTKFQILKLPLRLVWSTWSQAWDHDLSTCAGLASGLQLELLYSLQASTRHSFFPEENEYFWCSCPRMIILKKK